MADQPTQERRDEVLRTIAETWRSNWGQIDGRTGRDWIYTAISGGSAALDGLMKDLNDNF